MAPMLAVSAALRGLAVDLAKICEDLLLMSSGPRTGFAEIKLPARQPGSSIMPGKVNPVMVENLAMISYHVIGADTAVAWAASRGQLELNVMMPLMAHELLESLSILTTGCRQFARECVAGIEADVERSAWLLEQSSAMATPLAPYIGYALAADIAKEAVATGKTIRQLVIEKGVFTEDEVNQILDPHELTEPGVAGGFRFEPRDAGGLQAPDRTSRWRRLTDLFRPEDTRSTYDTVARRYADEIASELDNKPFDREFLDKLAASLEGGGRVADLGCGPGHVGAYLAERDANVVGLDLSSAMVEQAHRLYPKLEVVVGDMLALPFEDASLAGIVAFYSIIHFDDEQLATAFAEMRRVISAEGQVALAFHIGDEVLHREQWWDMPVVLDFRFLTPDLITRLLTEAGFAVLDNLERAPYPDVEYQSRRAYIVARPLRVAPRRRGTAAVRPRLHAHGNASQAGRRSAIRQQDRDRRAGPFLCPEHIRATACRG